MKKCFKKVVVLLFILSLTACEAKQESFETALQQEIEVVEDKAPENKESYYFIDEKQWQSFFEKYFGLSEEEVLELNQKPKQTDTAYWEAYQTKTEKLKMHFGKFLNKQCTTFHLPKMLEIDGYVAKGPAKLEKIAVLAVEPLGENSVYTLEVTTKNKCIDYITANRKYMWDAKCAYYKRISEKIDENINGQDSLKDSWAFYPQKDRSLKAENSYMFLEGNNQEDEIRLSHHYWIEVKNQENLEIYSLKEATTMPVEEELRQKACYTGHVKRIPYFEEIPMQDQKIALKVLFKLLSQDAQFFGYYQSALETNAKSLDLLFKLDLDLEEVEVGKDFEKAYSRKINPYKDNIQALELKQENMIAKVSIYATAKQPRFVVIVPMKVLLNNDTVVYYKYYYLVGLENHKVEFIHFLKTQQVS